MINITTFSFFFFQAEDGIRDGHVTGVQTCALPISNFGVLPLEFTAPSDYDRITQGDILKFSGLREALQKGRAVTATLQGEPLELQHKLSDRQVEMVLAGGRIPQRAAQDEGETPREEVKPAPPEG